MAEHDVQFVHSIISVLNTINAAVEGLHIVSHGPDRADFEVGAALFVKTTRHFADVCEDELRLLRERKKRAAADKAHTAAEEIQAEAKRRQGIRDEIRNADLAFDEHQKKGKS